MRGVSQAFLDTAATSHVATVRADLWYDGMLAAPDLAVIDGVLHLDDDAPVRAHLQGLRLADPLGELVPAPWRTTGLHVYGTEIHLRAGVALPTGLVEMVSLGWFVVRDVEVQERYRTDAAGSWISGGAVLTVDALDRMCKVDDSRFLAPGTPAPGARCLAEIRRLCRNLLPVAPWPAITDPLVPAGVLYEESRLDAVVSLAAAAQVKTYADADGALALRPSAPPGPPVAALSTDTAITTLAQRFTRDGAYNAVVARGETTGESAPIQAIAYHDDPASPTRWDGPYGRVPMFYSSPLLATPAQAASAAARILADQVAGRDRVQSFTAVANPALEPGDVVRVLTPRLGFVGVLTGIELPLAAAGGAATYTARLAYAEAV
jgi:hypothetical protein